MEQPCTKSATAPSNEDSAQISSCRICDRHALFNKHVKRTTIVGKMLETALFWNLIACSEDNSSPCRLLKKLSAQQLQICCLYPHPNIPDALSELSRDIRGAPERSKADDSQSFPAEILPNVFPSLHREWQTLGTCESCFVFFSRCSRCVTGHF